MLLIYSMTKKFRKDLPKKYDKKNNQKGKKFSDETINKNNKKSNKSKINNSNKNNQYEKINNNKNKFSNNKIINNENSKNNNSKKTYDFQKNKKINNNKNNISLNKKLNKNNFFENKYNSIFGNQTFQNLLQLQKQLKNNQFIRINESKTTKEKVIEFFNKNRIKYKETFLENAIKIEKSFFSISSSYPSLTGDIYLQDLASQVVINTIDFESLKQKNKQINILDMCASPGSKTTHLSDKLKSLSINHKIIALEPEEKRIQKLINNLQKQNVKNIKLIQTTAQNYKPDMNFDLIIIDAPCSGNLISDNNWLKKRNQQGIENNAKIQKEILKKASSISNKDTQIIYSTCSLEIEENELNIEHAIDKLNLKPQKINLNIPFSTTPILKFNNKKLDTNIKNCIRFMPEKSKTEGFFICKLSK